MLDIHTDRLHIREITVDDAPFILSLYSEPAFKQFIGDRGLTTAQDAEKFIEEVFRQDYKIHGHGLCLLLDRTTDERIGVAGLLKREYLPHVDLGYAISSSFWRHGYAEEAARALIKVAVDTFRLTRLAAITDPTNSNSIGLLLKLGFEFEARITVNGENSNLYHLRLAHR